MDPRPIRILLVEDNPADVRLMRITLEQGKIHCLLDVAGDGEEALAYLEGEGREDTRLPDLVLLDLNMPRMDGRELLERMKQHPEFRVIPVVVLTSSEAEADIVRAYGLGAAAYVSKPLDLGQLSKITEAIEGFWLSIVKFPTQTSDG